MDGTHHTKLNTRVTPLRVHLLAGMAMFTMLTHLAPYDVHAADAARGYISPLPELSLDIEPLYPKRMSAEVAREEAALKAQAEREKQLASQREAAQKQKAAMAAEKAHAGKPFQSGSSAHAAAKSEGGRIAPLPTGVVGVHRDLPAKPRDDIDHSIHVEAAPPIAETTTLRLGKGTKKILASVPSKMDMPAPVPRRSINLKRVSKSVTEVVTPEEQYKDFEKAGISISMRRGVYDASRQLSKAYNALVAGDDLTAISIYREVVSQEPRNEEALFGLATTYHRAGAMDLAKPVYEQLLKVNPKHREGLNNFLAMVADYAPDDALPELEALAARNPHYSPIHAQVGMLYGKLGQPKKAKDKLLYAIRLAPHNLVYQYNLGVLLDQQGEVADAVAIYRKLVGAHGRGANVPADMDAIQRRLNFLVQRYNRKTG